MERDPRTRVLAVIVVCSPLWTSCGETCNRRDFLVNSVSAQGAGTDAKVLLFFYASNGRWEHREVREALEDDRVKFLVSSYYVFVPIDFGQEFSWSSVRRKVDWHGLSVEAALAEEDVTLPCAVAAFGPDGWHPELMVADIAGNVRATHRVRVTHLLWREELITFLRAHARAP